jgi:hypothetical protein
VAERSLPDVLGECLDRWEQPQASIHDLLAAYPEYRQEIEELLAVASALWALPHVHAPERLRRDPAWRRVPTRAPLRMPLPLPIHRSAAAVDVLAECLDRAEDGAVTGREALGAYPEHRQAVGPLLDVAARLRALPEVHAPQRLRQDPLWRRAATAPAAAERPAPTSLPLWAAARAPEARPQRPLHRLGRIAAGVGGATFALLLAGTVATSASSLPDNPLYPVKRLVEDAQLALARPDDRLEMHLHRAQERMRETRAMVERDRPEVVASLADAYVREVDAVRQELQSNSVTASEPQQVGRVLNRLEANEQALGAIVERAPEPARPALARAVEASRPESLAPAPEVSRVVPEPRPQAPTFSSAARPASAVTESNPPASNPPASVRQSNVDAPALSQVGPTATPLPPTAVPPTATPPRVQVPSGAAPALLPSSSPSGPAASPTPVPPTSLPTAVPASAPPPTLQPPASPTLIPPASGLQSSSTGTFQLLPPVAAPTPSANGTNAGGPARSNP